MQPHDGHKVLSDFMSRLASSTASILLLDYDGTLAPFQTDRHQAYPYPTVMPILDRILRCSRSRVVIISGRPVAELGPLLSPLRNMEVWGSHGLERLSADGRHIQTAIAPQTAALLSQAESLLHAAGLARMIEIKPGGIAVHWRGLEDREVHKIRSSVTNSLSAFAEHPELKLLEFEGGLELRVTHPDKGDAVTSILNGSEEKTQVAYLGDDLTDEDAFRVLNPRGLTVLVRGEYRATSARVWLRPPDELVRFLEQWLNSVSPAD